MHISGKLAAWLAVIAIVVAVYFSARTFAIRDAWMERAQKNEAEIRKNDEEIAKRTSTRNDARTKLARTMLAWDRVWTDVAVTGNVAGELNLQLGTPKGVQQDQVLYVFVPNADGTSTYLGDFKVTRVAETACQAKPNSRRRPTDDKQVQAQNARVRTLIPNEFLSRLGALDQQLLATELTIASNDEELKRQATLSEQSDGLIGTRMGEINGNDQLQGKPLPPVIIKGLLTSIVEEEEAWHASLLEADRLMRALKQARDDFARIRAENEKRVQSLSQPALADPAVGVTGP